MLISVQLWWRGLIRALEFACAVSVLRISSSEDEGGLQWLSAGALQSYRALVGYKLSTLCRCLPKMMRSTKG